jgi:phosphate-selective porin OprO/OprP
MRKKWNNKRWLSLTMLSLSLVETVIAQVVDPHNVLIQNVYLVGADKAAAKPLVSILIEDNKLALVSQDEISIEEGVMAVDGREGYVLGNLIIGETPDFMILNQDPRESFEVMLDTSFFTVFALHNGRLIQNNLFVVDQDEIKEEQEKTARRGWQAYTPPPMALPLDYLDTTKWNRWESKWVSGLFVWAVLLDRQYWTSQDSNSEQQVGDLASFEGGEIRGLRYGAIGTINFKRPWVYTLFGATNAFDKGFETEQLDEFQFTDYRLDIPLFKKTNLSVGNQKEPISMERLMGMAYLPMQERSSVSDAFLPSRNFGVVVSGAAKNQRMTWAGGVFNNWVNMPGSIGDNPTATIGRVTWLPFLSEDESNLLHLGLGVRHTTAELGVRAKTEPEFNNSPEFVNTDILDADSSLLLNLEASWRKGPYWVAAEYIDSAVDSPTFGDLDFSGYHLTASWILTGEMRPYNKKSGLLSPVPIAKNVNQDGKGAWEIGARFSSLDLTDGLVDGGEMDIWSLGVNWWLTPLVNVNLNYRYITLDRFGVRGTSHGLMTRVVLALQ